MRSTDPHRPRRTARASAAGLLVLPVLAGPALADSSSKLRMISTAWMAALRSPLAAASSPWARRMSMCASRARPLSCVTVSYSGLSVAMEDSSSNALCGLGGSASRAASALDATVTS